MRADLRHRREADADFHARMHAEQGTAGKGFLIVTGEALLDLANHPVPRQWPACDTCGRTAAIVCVSPCWDENGFLDSPDEDLQEAHFCCRDHAGATDAWSWYWLIEPDPERGDAPAPNLREWELLTHLASKRGGGPFIGWLLQNFNLADWALADSLASDGDSADRTRTIQ